MLANLKKESNIIKYEKKKRKRKMARKKGNKQASVHNNAGRVNGTAVERHEESDESQRENESFAFLKKNAAAIAVGVGILIIWWIIHDLPAQVTELRVDNERILGKLETVETRLDSLEGNYESLNRNSWSKNIKESNEKLFDETVEPEVLLASETFSINMMGQNLPENDNGNAIADLQSIEDDTVIGQNRESEKQETKKDIENKPFITYYKDNGEDVFFFGKYNENGQWDGRCLINCYNDSKLTSIMEAEYDKGKLIQYQHVFRGKTLSGTEVWYVSDREAEKNKNGGHTTTYFFYGDCKKDFDIHSIKEEDMISVEKFLETIPSNMEGYYSGYTSDGRYNDESGNAYLVKYNNDGSVRYLYRGKIKDGVADDDTGEAWTFSWGDANDGYHYHKGVFKEGEAKNTADSWNDPVDQDFINQIVNSDDFDCPLKGLIK